VGLPDGRKLVAQVDGGTGHSGRRSPDIHFGLGPWEKSKAVAVEIKWRDREGKVQQTARQLTPGWHTIELGGADVLARGKTNTETLAQGARFQAVDAHSHFQASDTHTQNLR
jgi:hypothetical protein